MRQESSLNICSSGYKAKLQRVTPSANLRPWSSFKSCYLGVSLGNDTFQRADKLAALLEWISERFEEGAVVIGDSIYRLTIQILEGIPEEIALLKARKLCDAFIATNSYLFNSFSRTKFQPVTFSAIAQSDIYQEYFAQLINLFKNDSTFSFSVKASATEFVMRQFRRRINLKTTYDEALTLSTSYILEEISGFACLVSNGYEIEIYPGNELQVLAEIAEGHHQGVPEPLKNRINIALSIKRKCPGELVR